MYTPDLPPAPAVSVIIPAYRCAGFIADALASVLRQSFTDREIIVVNDGCPETQALEAILTHYRNDIRYMRRPHGGPAAARNTGLEFARGRYLAFLDADDRWDAGLLDALVPLLDADKDLDLLYTDALVTEGERTFRFLQAFPTHGAITLDTVLAGQATIPTSATLVRAARVREAGPFDTRLPVAEDYDLWLRLLADGARARCVRQALAHLRFHPQRLCADALHAEHGALQVLRKLEQRADLSEPVRRTLERALRRVRGNIARLERERERGLGFTA